MERLPEEGESAILLVARTFFNAAHEAFAHWQEAAQESMNRNGNTLMKCGLRWVFGVVFLCFGGDCFAADGAQAAAAVPQEAVQTEAVPDEAETLFRKGLQYYQGETVAQSYAEAVRYFREAAARGSVRAQAALGVVYARGEGVEQSPAEAVVWLRKAAEKGHAGAQYNLAECYGGGIGVEQSYETAVAWLHKAAAQGDVDAQHRLGMCYGYPL